MSRIYNFFPGPAALPQEALAAAHDEFFDFEGTGLSLLEMSHRTEAYERVHREATDMVRELLDVPSDYKILWLQGGASLQFSMLPMNVLKNGQSADYVLTDYWSERALTEAQTVARAHIAGSSKQDGYRYIPTDLYVDPCARYLHITHNATIFGTQYHELPKTYGVPIVADMSSDIMWRKVDVRRYGMIYAGAHKNLGPSGATLVIVNEEFLRGAPKNLPSMLRYDVHIENESMYNTPPTFTIAFIGHVLRWIKAQGGLDIIEARNREKARKVYDFIDSSDGFYVNDVAREDRSMMNVVFNMATPELEARFVAEAKMHGFIGLANRGERGGCRISIYNAVGLDAVDSLLNFMADFMVQMHIPQRPFDHTTLAAM
ncbi:MAG: 3-phosphoserine/phosphohydroxythreonine transaminase [Deltaproteobacteria bacterium]|nr:3-phosphoserine/phosphohydroxythreonine transaminase [Deltaproteobacteria bacterium]